MHIHRINKEGMLGLPKKSDQKCIREMLEQIFRFHDVK